MRGKLFEPEGKRKRRRRRFPCCFFVSSQTCDVRKERGKEDGGSLGTTGLRYVRGTRGWIVKTGEDTRLVIGCSQRWGQFSHRQCFGWVKIKAF